MVSDATARLLWAAARPALALDEVRAALANGADVDRASVVALGQHLGPLLHRALTAAGTTPPPALVRDTARCHAQSRMVLPTVGEFVLAPLAAAGVQAVIIKGAALASRYPDPGLRPMDDIDLLAPPQQFEQARTVLLQAGWRLPAKQGLARHETTLTHPSVSGLAVDLHGAWATWRSRSNRLSTDALWTARREVPLFGSTAYVLPPEEELVMLTAHAAKPFHNFDRLIWIADLVVVAGNAGFDWERAARLARDARCRVALAVGLTQAQRLGLESPDELRALDPRKQRQLAPLLREDWPVVARTPLLRDRARYAVVDDARSAINVAIGEGLGSGVRAMPFRTLRVMKRGARRAWRRYAETT